MFAAKVKKAFTAAAPNLTIHFPFSHNTHRFLVSMSAPFGCHDDGGWVRLAKGHMRVWQRGSAEGPGRVHVRSLDTLQLRNPLPHIVALKKQTNGNQDPSVTEISQLSSHFPGFIAIPWQQTMTKLQTKGKKGNETNNSCIFSNIHCCRSQGLAWSCWTSCSPWGHFLYQRCTASCRSCCRHRGQSMEEHFLNDDSKALD